MVVKMKKEMMQVTREISILTFISSYELCSYGDDVLVTYLRFHSDTTNVLFKDGPDVPVHLSDLYGVATMV